MEEKNLEQVKELINRIADSYDLPTEEQVEYWTDTSFWLIEYGRGSETEREHQLLRFFCFNMSEQQIDLIIQCMESFRCPLQIREEVEEEEEV